MLSLTHKTSATHNIYSTALHALYLANLNTFPDLDSSEEFCDKILCPTLLVYTNSKILCSCKYNNPNQLFILETLLIKRKMPELNCGLKASKQLSLLLRLPVGRGGVINSPRFCFFFFSRVESRRTAHG